MVESLYTTEVLLNDRKNKIFALVLYGRILIEGIEVCKIPLEIDTLTDDMFYATLEYDIFIQSWELQRIESSKLHFNQIIRFYTNVENLKRVIAGK